MNFLKCFRLSFQLKIKKAGYWHTHILLPILQLYSTVNQHSRAVNIKGSLF